MVTLGDFQKDDLNNNYSGEKIVRTFHKISKQYTARANRLLKNDSGKEKFDKNDYANSFIYFVQSLILSGQLNDATDVCADSGRSWGKRLNIFRTLPDQTKAQSISYLHAFALYKKGQVGEATQMIQARFNEHPLGNYLLGHIAFLQGHYEDALGYLASLDINKTKFPKHIYLPVTYDCTIGDEILFLRAASIFKLNDRSRLEDCLQEFAMIPRFFPDSDFAKFLLNGDTLMSRMLEFYRNQKYTELEILINDMIQSYIKSFSDGSLREESYTYHYR